MVESKDIELSVDQFKDVSGGFNGDAQCNEKMGQGKMFRKVKNSPTWPTQPVNWNGIEIHENSIHFCKLMNEVNE